jgi:hypothetical protein
MAVLFKSASLISTPLAQSRNFYITVDTVIPGDN